MSIPDRWRSAWGAWISVGWSAQWQPRSPTWWRASPPPSSSQGRASPPGEYRLEIGDLLLALVQDQVPFELFQVSQHGLGQTRAILAFDQSDQGGVRHM